MTTLAIILLEIKRCIDTICVYKLANANELHTIKLI